MNKIFAGDCEVIFGTSNVNTVSVAADALNGVAVIIKKASMVIKTRFINTAPFRIKTSDCIILDKKQKCKNNTQKRRKIPQAVTKQPADVNFDRDYLKISNVPRI